MGLGGPWLGPLRRGGPFHVKEPPIMSTPQPPNETPAERDARLTRARASAAAWEAYFRALGGLPPAEPALPRWDESDTFPDLLATHDPDGTPR